MQQHLDRNAAWSVQSFTEALRQEETSIQREEERLAETSALLGALQSENESLKASCHSLPVRQRLDALQTEHAKLTIQLQRSQQRLTEQRAEREAVELPRQEKRRQLQALEAELKNRRKQLVLQSARLHGTGTQFLLSGESLQQQEATLRRLANAERQLQRELQHLQRETARERETLTSLLRRRSNTTNQPHSNNNNNSQKGPSMPNTNTTSNNLPSGAPVMHTNATNNEKTSHEQTCRSRKSLRSPSSGEDSEESRREGSSHPNRSRRGRDTTTSPQTITTSPTAATTNDHSDPGSEDWQDVDALLDELLQGLSIPSAVSDTLSPTMGNIHHESKDVDPNHPAKTQGFTEGEGEGEEAVDPRQFAPLWHAIRHNAKLSGSYQTTEGLHGYYESTLQRLRDRAEAHLLAEQTSLHTLVTKLCLEVEVADESCRDALEELERRVNALLLTRPETSAAACVTTAEGRLPLPSPSSQHSTTSLTSEDAERAPFLSASPHRQIPDTASTAWPCQKCGMDVLKAFTEVLQRGGL